MRKETFNGLKKINNEGMKSVKGGYTLNTVTVIGNRKKKKSNCLSEAHDDGDDGIHND